MISPARFRLLPIALASVCLVIIVASSVTALQGTPESQSATPAASPISADATPVADESPTFFGDVFRPFSDLGFRDQTASSSQSTIDYFLPLPPGVTPVVYSALDLSISHSPLLQPELSTMTVFSNGVAISSVYLDETNLNRTKIQIELPTEDFVGDGFLIQIRFSLRLSTETCEQSDNQALWATVHSDSTFYFSMIHTLGTADLATLNRQFTNLLDPVSIVIPETPSAAELDAAGKVAFELGRWNGNSINQPVVTFASASTTTSGPTILIGTGVSLNDQRDWGGLSWDGSAFQSTTGAVPADFGVIALTQDPNPILLVSGANDAALAKAAAALVNPYASAVFNGPFAIVTGQELVAQVGPTAWSENATSFAQLGLAARETRGEGTHTVTFTTTRPSAWTAGNGGNLTLSFQSSPTILPESSWISVTVNGVEVGTTSLVSSVDPTPYTFPLPAEVVNASLAGTLRVDIVIHLQLPTEPCKSGDPSNAWITLLDDSSWSIPHNTYTGLDLARLPAPFTSEPMAPFLIALPDAPTTADIDAAIHIALAFGKRTGQQSTGLPRLIRASEVTGEQRESTSIVILGGPGTNSLAASLDSRDALPAIVSQTDATSVVKLSIVPSPWFSGGAVLSIIPDGSVGASSVARLFSDATTLAALAGTSAIVDPNLLPETTGLAEVALLPPDSTPIVQETGTQVTPPQPTPTEESAVIPSIQVDAVQDDDPEFEGWKVAGSILLGGFVVAIGTFGWIRNGRKHEPDI